MAIDRSNPHEVENRLWDEIEDAQWFPYDSLPRLPAGRSIARYLIESWLARRAGRPDPILPGGGY